MEKTDRQTDKSSRWAFTAYEDQWNLFESMPPGVAEWGWNAEVCPKTNRKHYQGYLRLTQQQRFAWLRKLLPGVHIEISKNWEALKKYCQKEETRISGTQPTHQESSFMTLYQYTDDVAKRFANQIQTKEALKLLPKVKLIGYIDLIVRRDIESGKRYAGHIATNPQWVTLWNKYAYELIFSFISIDAPQISQQEDSVTPQDGEASQESDQEGRDGQVD